MAQYGQQAVAWANSRRTLVLILLGAIVAVILLYVVAVLVAGDGIRPGTTVAGVSIGRLSEQEAIDKLNSTVGAVASKPLILRIGDQDVQVNPAEAGLTFDAAATVASASGRTLNPFTLLSELLSSNDLTPVTVVDQSALDAQLESVATTLNTPPKEPTLVVVDKKPESTPGEEGLTVDAAAAGSAMKAAFMEKRKPITVDIVPAPPTVSADGVKKAKDLVRTALNHPVFVKAGNIKVKIPTSAIAKALSFTVKDGALVPVLDGAILHEAVAYDLVDVEAQGRDATLKIVDGNPVVVPEKVGKGISNDELSTQVATVLGNEPPHRKVAVSMGTRDPLVTAEQLSSLGVKEEISSFTQNFPYAAYRVQNIGEAARRINGTLLLPGDTFSMNDTIKERTEANGYTVGFVIGEGGVFAEELGGGVSTATTTMWTAAFFAGMERVFTQAHSIYISRYKAGLEATVAWGSFDMQFKNNTPYAVYITTKMTNTSMTATFWSTKIYSKIVAEFSEKKDLKPFPTMYDKSKKCLGQSGMKGFTIDVDRVFYKDDVEVKRETITTNYKPAPEVICGKDPDRPLKPTKPGAGGDPIPQPTSDTAVPTPG